MIWNLKTQKIFACGAKIIDSIGRTVPPCLREPAPKLTKFSGRLWRPGKIGYSEVLNRDFTRGIGHLEVLNLKIFLPPSRKITIPGFNFVVFRRGKQSETDPKVSQIVQNRSARNALPYPWFRKIFRQGRGFLGVTRLMSSDSVSCCCNFVC